MRLTSNRPTPCPASAANLKGMDNAVNVRRKTTSRRTRTMTCGTRTRSSTSCTSGVLRQQRRRHRRFSRPDRASSTTFRILASPRSGCCRSIRRRCKDDGYDIADYIDVNPDLRHAARISSLSDGGASPRLARHHRARDEPHVGPASVVSTSAPQPSPARRCAQLVRLERHRQEISRGADHLQDSEPSNWTWDPVAEGLLLASLSTRINPI